MIMGKQDLDKNLEKIEYRKNKAKWGNIKNFLKENHQIAFESTKNYLKSVTYNMDNPKEKLRALFVDSLNATGGSKLRGKGQSIIEFWNKIKDLDEKNKIEEKCEEFISLIQEKFKVEIDK